MRRLDVETIDKRAQENAKKIRYYVDNTMPRRFVLPVEISDDALKAASYAACRIGGGGLCVNGKSVRNYKLRLVLVRR